jgi:hypothetical protein
MSAHVTTPTARPGLNWWLIAFFFFCEKVANHRFDGRNRRRGGPQLPRGTATEATPGRRQLTPGSQFPGQCTHKKEKENPGATQGRP